VEYWSNGIMEQFKNGMMGFNVGIMEHWKNRKSRNHKRYLVLFLNPIFQYSNTPILQYSYTPFTFSL
jgi:hypothetical protein